MKSVTMAMLFIVSVVGFSSCTKPEDLIILHDRVEKYERRRKDCIIECDPNGILIFDEKDCICKKACK